MKGLQCQPLAVWEGKIHASIWNSTMISKCLQLDEFSGPGLPPVLVVSHIIVCWWLIVPRSSLIRVLHYHFLWCTWGIYGRDSLKVDYFWYTLVVFFCVCVFFVFFSGIIQVRLFAYIVSIWPLPHIQELRMQGECNKGKSVYLPNTSQVNSSTIDLSGFNK